MATRSVESGIPRTYGGSLRLAGHGIDAIVRAKIGLVYALSHTVAVGTCKGASAASAGIKAARARKAEIAAAAGDAATKSSKHSNTPVIVGAVAGLAMVGAGIALLKYRSGQAPESVDIKVDYDDDAQLDEAAV